MNKFDWGLVYWWGFWVAVAFMVPELLAQFWNGCPWPTLSQTTWGIENKWEPFSVALIAFLFVLCLHLVLRLSVVPVLIVSVATAVAVVIHFAR